MPTSSLTTPTLNSSTSTSRNDGGLPNWLREPLLHFIVLGGLLFAVDHLLADKADNPHLIVVGPEVDSEAAEIFKATRGREPTNEERSALHRVWLDNEVLYREGLNMQLDKGDSSIRERVIFKALSIIDAGINLPVIDDKELKAWFDKHHDKYDEPARFNFQEAALSGNATEADVRSFVAALNNGTPGDAQAGLRVFKDRPISNLAQSYGEEFPKTLEAMPKGEWRALQTRDGWRAIQLDSVSAPKPADFEILRGVVLQDWKDATAAEKRTAAVRALEKKYTVEFAPSTTAGR